MLNVKKRIFMQSTWKNLSAAQLRIIFINEMRRFALALEYGASLVDLQEIKDQIKEMGDLLSVREKEEDWWGGAQVYPQSTMRSATA